MALLKFKRSAVPAKVPSIADLDLGELAINTYDGKVYTKKDDGTQAIVQVGGGGGVQTITSSDGSVTVTGTTDINLSVATAAATNTVLLPVRNNTGATLAKGTAVYINGALGQNPTVTKAIATGDATSAQTLGLVTANIANNAVGNVTLIGSLTNLDTSAYSDGQQLYLSPTTAGALTATKPYAPSHLVYMAVVEHAHPSLGKLFVKVQNGYEMDELHDVSAQNPANNDGLFYNTTSGLWEKKSIATALGYTPANKAGDAFTSDISVPITKSFNCYTVNYGMGTPDSSGLQIYAAAGDTMRFGHRTGGVFTERFIMGTGGNVTANVDFRAPIFYDSNNTAYYVDPASTGTSLITAGGVYAAGQVRAAGWWGEASASATGLAVEIGESGGRCYITAYSRDAAAYGPMSIEASDFTFTGVSGGFVGVNTSVRAPIFYDSNNTAFYVDPATGSSFSGATFSDLITGRSSLSTDVNTANDTGSISIRGSTTTVAAMSFHRTGAYAMNMGLGTDNVFRIGGWSAQSNCLQVFGTGVVQALNDFRAPLFYDSNNTAYYVDPNSGGLALRTSGYWIADSTAWAGDINGKIQYHDNSWYISAANQWVFRASSGAEPFRVTQGGIAIASADMRAPIFYDNNNTGYYVDPNSTSNLAGLTVANRINGSVTGCTFAQDSQDQDNITLRTDSGFYQSSTGTNAEGWPLNDSGWQHMISCTHTNDGNYFAMQLAAGFFSTGLFYRSVNNNGAQAWSRVALYGNGYAAPLYANIYYDADNTGYYVDPASTSYLNTVSLGAQTWRGDITWNTAVNVVIPASAECSFDVNSSGTWQVWDLTSNAPMIKATAGTNVEIGGAGSRGLYVYGSITASGNVTAYSDRRLKDNIEQITSALSKVRQLCGVTFTRTDLPDTTRKYAGLLAQDVEKVLPEAVQDVDGKLAVDYNATIGLLVEAIKELEEQVAALKNRS